MSSSANGRVRVVVVDDEEAFRAVGRSLDEALLKGSAASCFLRKQDLSPTCLRELWATAAELNA